MRIRVTDVLEMLAQGVSAAEILSDFPDLEKEDDRSLPVFPLPARADIARLVA